MNDLFSVDRHGFVVYDRNPPSIYDGNPPSQPTPTSEAAADQIKPHMTKLQDRVYGALRAAGSDGMTDEELTMGLDMNPSTLRPRRRELQLSGRIKAKVDMFDTSCTRKTKSGRAAQVWIVK